MTDRFFITRRYSDGQAMVHMNPDRPYWARPMLLRGEPLILDRGHVAKFVTFHGDGDRLIEVVGCELITYTIGDLDPASEREQAAYELGVKAKRRLGFEEVQRKGWSPDEMSAYQQGIKDRS